MNPKEKRETLVFGGREIEYRLKKSRRARSVRLSVSCEGAVSLTIPWRLSLERGKEFLYDKINWIIEKVDYFEKHKDKRLPKSTRSDYLANKWRALEAARERAKYFNQFYRFSFANISIRDQKTRWGSCSRKGNLSFSWKIILLNDVQRDYIIVHELCHLKEFNHSANFWQLVEKTVPEYKKIRKEIRKL
ncbi:MAG: hypothetical protein QG620_662 [Patescibacteria group bacterium]|nr:hypothetical protein [Patescibacteria group bacterium]